MNDRSERPTARFAVEIRGLTKRYGDTVAVQDVSFTAPPGAVTGFLGPNGAGKTTTLRAVLGLAQPDTGEATIGGQAYADLAHPRRRVGAVIDTMGFHPGRSGRNHLRVVARAAGIDKSRVEQVLGIVDLSSAADRRVAGYSQGMRQRLALATALLGDPPVLVLDEPTNGLDPAGIAWLRQLMGDWASQGRTVLFSSHQLSEVEIVADRIVIIDRGRVVRDAPADEPDMTEPAVVVGTPDAARFADIAKRSGWRVRRDGPDRLILRGATPAEVGAAAADAGVTLSELTSDASNRHLEELFFEVTRPETEVRP